MQSLQQGLTTQTRVCASVQRCVTPPKAEPRLRYKAIQTLGPAARLGSAGIRGCGGTCSRQVQLIRCCQRGPSDWQPKLTRQSVYNALKDAAQNEKGYLLKLLIVSAIGAAAVKFGSLAINTPFQPSGIVALSIITIPCLMYSGLLLRWKDE